ncbi:hypothetical protein [Kitasatospora sp. NPDC057015]|uniref:hypothetical protein n=1 Tax=Kitasatospora sp. NPDC057015 TaxID=3346001 RepID=UPI00363AE12E
MTCAEYRAAMSAHLDGEGGPGPGPHPDSCADCAQWLAVARRLRELASRAPGPSPAWSDGLLERLGDALPRAAHRTADEAPQGPGTGTGAGRGTGTGDGSEAPAGGGGERGSAARHDGS